MRHTSEPEAFLELQDYVARNWDTEMLTAIPDDIDDAIQQYFEETDETYEIE